MRFLLGLGVAAFVGAGVCAAQGQARSEGSLPAARHVMSEEKSQTVLLVTRFSGGIDFVDPATLHALGTILTGGMVGRVTPRPDGQTLIVAQARPAEPKLCCALYSLDLDTREMHELAFPAIRAVLSADGQSLLEGGETIDLQTLTRESAPPGPRRRYPVWAAADGRWLFGLWNWPNNEWAVEIFDRKSNATARSLALPGAKWVTGTGAREAFYALAYGKEKGMATLWSVTPETPQLPPGKEVNLHELGTECRVPHSRAKELLLLQQPLAAGGRLFVYEGFGGKFDRRQCAVRPSGGIYVIDPATGKVAAHLAPSLYFLQLAASCDGEELYGIEIGAEIGKRAARLVRLDAQTGKILASRDLGSADAPSDARGIAVAILWEPLVPRGNVRAVETPARSWAGCPLTRAALDQPPQDPKASPIGFGAWYINEQRTNWFPRSDWRARIENKVIILRPAGTRLSVTGLRLDGPAPPLQLDRGPSETPSSFFAVLEMSFPSEGCWEMKVTAGKDELRFVAPVLPPLRKERERASR
jgi:hypothetical protein